MTLATINNNYSYEYIQQVTTQPKIQPPDEAQANGTYDALFSLFIAHQSGGPHGAKVAWQALRKFRPELDRYEKPPLLIHADQLRHLSSPTYMLTEYAVYHKAFNVIVGPSSSGKSFISLDIAGKVSQCGSVVYIAGEGLSGYAARWEAWKSFNQPDRPTHLFFYAEALQMMNEREVLEFIELIRHHSPIMVIVDTMARSAVGLEENSARDVGLFIHAVDAMRSALDCTAIVVHHTGKGGTIRGSSALYGAADSVLSVTSMDGLVTVSNHPDAGGKNKYNEPAPALHLRIKPHSANGLAGAVIVPADQMIMTPEHDNLNDKQIKILNALDGFDAGLQVNAIIDATGLAKTTVYHHVKLLARGGFISSDEGVYTITEMGKNAV